MKLYDDNIIINYYIMNKLNNCVGDNYRLIREIGKGSFGVVYLVKDKEGNEFACKTEIKGTKNILKKESFIYKRFVQRNIDCVPKFYKYIGTEEYNLLIIQLLGKSLEMILDECNRKIDIGTVMKIGIVMISNIEKIHRSGIIHRDIKPANFMFGTGDNANILYIMDFGLSKKWTNDKRHIEIKTDRSMIGTARYASLNIHLGIEPSRRDDMESIGYTLIYLAKGSLPWQGIKKDKKSSSDAIKDVKMMTSLDKLCEGLPDCFYKYINYTRNLVFTEKPDYDYLQNLFIESAKNNSIELKYYWEGKNTPNNGGKVNSSNPNSNSNSNNVSGQMTMNK